MRLLKTNFARLISDALILSRPVRHNARAYGFSTSSVSLSKLAVMSSGPSMYCEYGVNRGYAIIAEEIISHRKIQVGRGNTVAIGRCVARVCCRHCDSSGESRSHEQGLYGMPSWS